MSFVIPRGLKLSPNVKYILSDSLKPESCNKALTSKLKVFPDFISLCVLAYDLAYC